MTVLKFETLIERMSHPQAKLIPQPLWKDLWIFNSELDESLLPLMQAENGNQAIELARQQHRHLCGNQAWLCIAVTYKDLSAKDLINLARNILYLSLEETFVLSIEAGFLEMSKSCLQNNDTEDKQNLIRSSDFQAFYQACVKGHLHVAKWLLEQSPSYKDDMIKACDFRVFTGACANGHLDIAKWLLEQASDYKDDMIMVHDFLAFLAACVEDQQSIVQWLLEQSIPCFAYAEMNEMKPRRLGYGNLFAQSVYPFITQKLSLLHKRQEDFRKHNPNAVFNLDNKEATFCFYMLRNLIRRNDPALLDEIRFLLDIPAVKALAHCAVTPDQPNELITLALSIGNQEAAAILLTIPVVDELAQGREVSVNQENIIIEKINSVSFSCEDQELMHNVHESLNKFNEGLAEQMVKQKEQAASTQKEDIAFSENKPITEDVEEKELLDLYESQDNVPIMGLPFVEENQQATGEDLKQVLKHAQRIYQAWFSGTWSGIEDSEKKGIGRIKHSNTGQKRVSQLITSIENKNEMDAIFQELQAYLNNSSQYKLDFFDFSKTRCHRHSFSTFFLRLLSETDNKNHPLYESNSDIHQSCVRLKDFFADNLLLQTGLELSNARNNRKNAFEALSSCKISP